MTGYKAAAATAAMVAVGATNGAMAQDNATSKLIDSLYVRGSIGLYMDGGEIQTDISRPDLPETEAENQTPDPSTREIDPIRLNRLVFGAESKIWENLPAIYLEIGYGDGKTSGTYPTEGSGTLVGQGSFDAALEEIYGGIGVNFRGDLSDRLRFMLFAGLELYQSDLDVAMSSHQESPRGLTADTSYNGKGSHTGFRGRAGFDLSYLLGERTSIGLGLEVRGPTESEASGQTRNRFSFMDQEQSTEAWARSRNDVKADVSVQIALRRKF